MKINKQLARRTVLCVAIACISLVALATSARQLYALPGGISGYSGANGIDCSLCHEGGTTPLVAVSGASTIEPGMTVQMLLHITSTSPTSQTHAGWNVTVRDNATNAWAGTIGVVAGDTTSAIRDNELTHSQPFENQNGAVAVPFAWTAPITPGAYTVYFAGNSVNNSSAQRDTSGDAAAVGALQIMVESSLAVALTESGISPFSQQAAAMPAVMLIILLAATLLWMYRRN